MSDILTAEEKTAFDWASNQNFPSIAARYARMLSNALSRLMIANKETLLEYNRLYLENNMLFDANKALENDLINTTMNLELAEKRAEAAIAGLPRQCYNCKYKAFAGTRKEPCKHCTSTDPFDGATIGTPNWEWNDPTAEQEE